MQYHGDVIRVETSDDKYLVGYTSWTLNNHQLSTCRMFYLLSKHVQWVLKKNFDCG